MSKVIELSLLVSMNPQALKMYLILVFHVASLSAITTSVADDGYKSVDLFNSDEFASYGNLKHDSYDFSVINNVDDFLASSWPTSMKQAQCPLNQTDEQELVEKLNQIIHALKNSSCSNDKDSYFASFDASVSKIGQFYYSGSKINNTNPVSATQQSGYYQNMNDMMGSLSNLSSNQKCAFDIKERGLIPVLSDVIGSASVTALFIPNKYSLIAGTAGVAASASLKIIDGLLRPKFNMDKNDDRESFISLVCTFYEVRAQIDRQKFLHIATERDELNYQTALAFSTSIDSKLSILEARKKQVLQSLEQIRADYVAAQLTVAKTEFLEQLPQLKLKLASKELNSTWRFRAQLPFLLGEIAQHLESLNLENSNFALFSDLEADKKLFTEVHDPVSISKFIHQSDGQISEYFMRPLLKFEEIINADAIHHQENFERYIIYDDLNFSALNLDVSKVFDQKIDELNEAKNKINNYLNIIKKNLDKKNFVDHDQGTHIDHLIIRFLKDIESQLYGHVGWRFHEYIRNNAAQELRKFFSHYTKFNRHFLKPLRPIGSESLRRTACATASNIILTINNSRSLVNMGTDFIFTNRDFFHANIPLLDLHAKLIPTGWSIEQQFLVQAHSLIQAQERLKRHPIAAFPKILRNKNIFLIPTIGDLMIGQLWADNSLDKLYQFKRLNKCD